MTAVAGAGMSARAPNVQSMVRWLMASLVVLAALPSNARAAAGPTIYAHRGGAGIAPENTLGAFRQVHDRYGARGVWIEFDLQLAKDGSLVVIHDATLDRTTTCTGRVIDRTAAELQGCDARGAWAGVWPSFEPVPTFRAVLEEGKARGWRLFPEIKNIPGEPAFDPSGERAAVALIADVQATGFDTRDLVVQAFVPTTLDQIELRSGIATSLATTSQLPHAPAPGMGFYLTEGATFARARGYEIAEPDDASPDLRAETVAYAHALGMPVVVWTVDRTARMLELASFGVDGIITNRPDLAYATLG